MFRHADNLHRRIGVPLLALALLLMLALSIPRLPAGLDFARLTNLASARYGDDALSLLDEWRDLLQQAADAPLRNRLIAANDFFNSRIRWASDSEIYQVDDHWATPLETIGRRAGDCEDFSIAKYVTLLALDVPPETLRLVYVKARMPGGANQAHMVLAWYETPGAVPLILDNINTGLLPADQRRDLRPVFSFNADALWVGGRASPSGASPRARLSRWQQVLTRLADEGFTTAR